MSTNDQHSTATQTSRLEEPTPSDAATATDDAGSDQIGGSEASEEPPCECCGEVESRSAKAKRHGAWLAALCIQIAFLLGVCYVGNAISEYLPVPIPGNICSMALLLTLLVTGIINAEKIAVASNFLLSYMPVFFIPAGVTILTCLPIIQGHIPQFIAVCAITTVAVFLVTATVVVLVSRAQRAMVAKRSGRKSAGVGFRVLHVKGE